MSSVAIEPQRFETRALTLIDQARAIQVRDQQTFESASQMTLAAKALRKEIEAYHKPMKRAADEAKQKILDGEKRMLQLPLEVERILDPQISAYITEQKRLEEEARRAEAERARQEAERQRIQAAMEAEKARKEAEEQRLNLAAQAEAEGATQETVAAILEQPAPVSQEEVAAILEQPVIVVPIPVVPTFQQLKGISTRDNWRFEIVNVNLIPREYLIPDEKKIGGVVRAMKASTNIPGIRVYNEPSTVGRTGGR